MSIIDTSGDYTQRRLDHWGLEFALHRDCEYLGHQSKNMLQILIEHRGEMPARATGFKPIEIDREAQQIEDFVFEISRAYPERACVLRAMYCGRGRYSVERFETAKELVARCTKLPPLSKRQYFTLAALGEAQVEGMLQGVSRNRT